MLMAPSGATTYSTVCHRRSRSEASDLLRTLGTVLGTGLLTVFHASGIQRTANGVVTHTRQVLYTTATDQHHGVFLQVVAFTTDVGNHFETVGQTNLAHFTQCGVRLFRGRGVNTGAHTALLRAGLQRRHLALRLFSEAAFAHE